MSSIAISIDLSKIDKTKFYIKPDGRKFLDIILIESKERKFDNDFMAVQGLPKSDRDAGVRGAILGNGKWLGQKPTHTQPPRSQHSVSPAPGNTTEEGQDSGLPF